MIYFDSKERIFIGYKYYLKYVFAKIFLNKNSSNENFFTEITWIHIYELYRFWNSLHWILSQDDLKRIYTWKKRIFLIWECVIIPNILFLKWDDIASKLIQFAYLKKKFNIFLPRKTYSHYSKIIFLNKEKEILNRE